MHQNSSPHIQFGIDEIYLHQGFENSLLEKLQRRAVLSLDSEDIIVQKHVSHDMILVFHKKPASQSMIYKFLKFLDQYTDKVDFISSNTLLNEDELFSAISSKKFALITNKNLPKEMYEPLSQ